MKTMYCLVCCEYTHDENHSHTTEELALSIPHVVKGVRIFGFYGSADWVAAMVSERLRDICEGVLAALDEPFTVRDDDAVGLLVENAGEYM